MLRVCAILVAMILATSVTAQNTQVLVIDTDSVFQQSTYATELLGDLDAAVKALQEENQQLFDTLRAEELRLSELRKTTNSQEFSVMAAEFDENVRRIRQTQGEKERQLQAQQTRIRAVFDGRLSDVITQVMQDRGAAVVLDRTDGVIQYTPQSDITGEVVSRIDAIYAK
ncbi:MAG: OmpH family outer membrane protein [Pseudomonadota bacterium]